MASWHSTLMTMQMPDDQYYVDYAIIKHITNCTIGRERNETNATIPSVNIQELPHLLCIDQHIAEHQQLRRRDVFL